MNKTNLLTKLLLLCLCVVGSVNAAWADDTYYLQTPGATTPALSGDFYTGVPLTMDASATYDEVSYTKGLAYGSNTTSWNSNFQYTDRVVRYDCKTTETDFIIVAYNKHASKAQNVYYGVIKESALGTANTVGSLTAIECAKNSQTTSDKITVSNTRPSSVYFTVGNRDNCTIVQIIATEKGTALPTVGTVGYTVNFNKGRFVGRNDAAKLLDNGLEIYPQSSYQAGNSAYLQIYTKGTHYVKFDVATPMVLNLTTASTNQYTVSTTKGSGDNKITPTANTAKANKLTAAGTYYINPQGSNVQITGMSFSAAPVITYNANGGSGSMSNTYFAVADNGFDAPDGQVFDGWKDSESNDYNVGDEVESDVALYAQWRTPAVKHHVYYNLNGATAGTVPTQADVEEEQQFTVAAVPGDLVAPVGKEFLTWNDGKNDYAPGASYTMGTSDVTLTAKYVNLKCTAPTITKEAAFNFEHKGYKVTINNTQDGGTLKVSTDGETYTTQTSPYETYATTTTHYYAKTELASYDDSDVADLNVTNTFDVEKEYVAWVGVSKPANNDRLYNALKDVYNVVPVVYANDYSITAADDIKNSDLIFVDENISGGGNLAKGLKNFVNVKRMVNLKVWACTTASGRWGWGTAADLETSTIKFDDNYKFLDGVSFSEGHKVEFFKSGTTGKQVLTLDFDADGANPPANNNLFGSGTNDKTAMHAIVDAEKLDKQYLGLGLSLANVANYSDNAIIVVKNAIAMMFANEALNTTMASVSGTITTTGWNTFSSSYPLDLNNISGGKAYYAKRVDGTDVVLKPATGVVRAGEGLMIKGTPNEPFTINVAATGTAIDGNLLVGLPSGGTVAVSTDGSYNYVYAWQTANPSTTYGFYNVNSNAATLGAGKAYLHLTEAIPTSGRVSIIFDDEETTGIKAIDNEKLTMDNYYDLSGRKVAQPQKGLYIVNGKKVIVK